MGSLAARGSTEQASVHEVYLAQDQPPQTHEHQRKCIVESARQLWQGRDWAYKAVLPSH